MSGVDFDDSDELEEPRPPVDPDEPAPDATAAEPFFDVIGRADGTVRTRAGWVSDGDIESLEIDVTAPANRAEAGFSMAYGWYFDTLVALQQQAQAAEQAAVEEQEVDDGA